MREGVNILVRERQLEQRTICTLGDFVEIRNEDAYVFFHLESSPLDDWQSLDDFKGKRIGAAAGYTYTDEFWAAVKSKRIDVQQASSDERHSEKLLKGRVASFPVGPLIG